jgi:hypothetical protein
MQRVKVSTTLLIPRLAYMQDNSSRQDSEESFPLADYLDAHSGWNLILLDLIKTASREQESIYSKKMKEKISGGAVSQSSLYASLANKIKSGGLYIGMLSGLKGTASAEVEKAGKSEDDYSNVMLETPYAVHLGFD